MKESNTAKEQLVEIELLIGTDYSEGVSNVEQWCS